MGWGLPITVKAVERVTALDDKATFAYFINAWDKSVKADMGEPYNPKAETDWSKILAKCNQHIASAGAKQEFYRDAATMLTTVKWSWRNPTIHPRNTYTTDEASEIFASTRIFMNHLATQLAEEVS